MKPTLPSWEEEASRAPPPNLTALFDLRVLIDPVYDLGDAGITRRLISSISDGIFTGDRMSGRLHPVGADWLTIRPDQSIEMDVRGLMETDDGAFITMRHRGRWTIPADLWDRVMLADNVDKIDPARYSLHVSFIFETDHPDYLWLNNVIAIGAGRRTQTGVEYSVHMMA